MPSSFNEDEILRWKTAHILKYGNLDNANVTYFHQPSGFSDEAENLENLPGNRKYYENLAYGKSDTWVKQFIESEWGFSITGQPVVPNFREALHVSKRKRQWEPSLKLVIPMDPGIGGSAFLFMQEDYEGRLSVFKELVQEGYGVKRLIEDRLIPTLDKEFRGADFIIVPDPAAASRSPNDESTIVKMFRAAFGHERVNVETNNRFPLRLGAIDHYIGKLIAGEAAVQIDKDNCPMLIRALKGGWRYAADTKKDILKGADPDKNQFSHVGDTFGYGCRYYHRGVLRSERYGRPTTQYGTYANRGVRKYTPPSYHVR